MADKRDTPAPQLWPLAQVKDLEKSDVQTNALLVNKRPWYTRIPFTAAQAPVPSKTSLDDAELIPEANANWLSLVTFGWITPLLTLGYARPLEAPDLWKLQDQRRASVIAASIKDSFDRRVEAATDYNARLGNGDIKTPLRKRIWWGMTPGSAVEKERQWRNCDGKKKASLVWAMNDSVKWWFWSSAVLKIVSDVAQVTSPLVVRAIIDYANKSYNGYRLELPVPGIGEGVGLSLCLFVLQLVVSLGNHHYFYRSTSTGVLLRGGLIAAIYDRSLRFSSRARSTLTNGKLVNHISTDVSRIDFCAGFFHMAWTAPIQLAICLVLLVVQLGPSALAGFAFSVVATPIQILVMKRLFVLRRESMEWTDKRANLIQELLGGMKVIKFFAWEVPFLNRVEGYRKKEMGYIRSILLTRAAMNAVAMSLPAIAAVIAFVTYSATGHDLEPSIIFTSLTLFNLLRMPLMFLPMSLSTIADAANATKRLYAVFEAELLEDANAVDPELEVAVSVEDASFIWDAAAPEDGTQKEPGDGIDPTGDGVFRINNISMSIPRGSLVAVVGPVGSGKTSLLQGIIGEMRKTSGTVMFGGSVGFCPQSAWVQNATIRENICFGRPFEEERYRTAVKNACLEKDFEMLPDGDLTEVGEKGISLSGGQKQRLNICRTIYCDASIQIFDDPFSALDAHVGKSIFEGVFQDTREGKTRILVTHTLHFLPQVDYIYAISNGRIVEEGTYPELMSKGEAFSKFITEFGSDEQEDKGEGRGDVEQASDAVEVVDREVEGKTGPTQYSGVQPAPGLMQEEERNTGAIAWEVYKAYAEAGKGEVVIPFLFLSLALLQGSSVMSSYWLVWWQERTWNQAQGFYMGIYAALGASQAFAAFLMGAAFGVLTFFASQRLHKESINRVMYAPMSFFETTPLGRIMNRFSKDIDNMDNLLGDALRMFADTLSSIVGAIILVSIVLPWFLIGVFAVAILYIWAASFYRASARELKRLDAVLRSSLYAHFSESLTGLATIRAYKESDRFRWDNERRIDIENRAYWLTVTNQRWLGIRLDFLGALLTLIVALLAVGMRFTISPAQTGLLLSYILSVQQAFGWLVRRTADVENNMNSVERMNYYAKSIEQEAAHEIQGTKPPASWPDQGRVELENVYLSYRPGLPPVLKGLSMSVNAGEKIGIVGRTGAGKSSIMAALYRLVELSSGSIRIDDVDISGIGLTDLRKHLAIIPQDPLLFSGTFRSNLDPFHQHDDATLWDAMKRAYLTEAQDHHHQRGDSAASAPLAAGKDKRRASSGTQRPSVNRFTLDSVIEDEGGNLSIGQRSLVSLARALVRNAKIIILDEATASVDYETDRNIQDTIAEEFKDRTILCIAHRLRTIISYDRICVLDAGQIAEYDTPMKLFESNGVFKGMCERSSITLEDIKLANAKRHGERASSS